MAAQQPRETPNVRRVALELLLQTEDGHGFIDDLLGRTIHSFRERDRHLLQELAYGTMRHRSTLDHVLNFHLKHPTARQKPPVGWALRLAAYQLMFLDRIPVHAAVNQTLEGLKELQAATAGEVGFVNAVLHKLSKEIRKKTTTPPVEGDDPSVIPTRDGYCHFSRPVLPLHRLDALAHLALKYSHPHWLVERWLERYGEEETRALLARNNQTPSLSARVTSKAPSREEVLTALREEGWTVEEGTMEGCISIVKSHGIKESPTFQKGWFLVQDVTAIQTGAALKPPAGAKVLDLCSAPGSKAAQLVEAVGAEGFVVVADRSEERLALVQETLSRQGGSFRAVVVPEDPARIDLGESFTHILVDAPCSNTGVLARRPEVRWRLRPGDLASLAELQSGLLEAGLRHLEPGGKLLYATCSIEPDENENVVARAFARHGELTELETRLFLPHRGPGDGGFYSLLLLPR